jgi:hypothetical protein
VAEKLKVVNEGYVQFTITHNSDYVVADKDLAQTGPLPKTGSIINASVLVGSGIVLLLAGIVLLVFRKRKTN